MKALSVTQVDPRLHMQVQAMALSADVWGIVREKMAPTDWAKASGFSRESHATQWRFVVAELFSRRAIHRHLCLGQLQLNEWRACHSLCLNLWRLGKSISLYTSQSGRLNMASRKLPLLRCLHLVGRNQVTLTESSIEGMFVRLLTRHALVLTLQVHAIRMPLESLPNLQHLVLKLGAIPTWHGDRRTHESVFSLLSMLKENVVLAFRLSKT